MVIAVAATVKLEYCELSRITCFLFVADDVLKDLKEELTSLDIVT